MISEGLCGTEDCMKLKTFKKKNLTDPIFNGCVSIYSKYEIYSSIHKKKKKNQEIITFSLMKISTYEKSVEKAMRKKKLPLHSIIL